jgi:transposase
MDDWHLTAKQRKQLECTLHRTCDARVYRRTLAILEVSRGLSVDEVAIMLGVSRQSVYNWMLQYNSAEGAASLEDRPRSGRPRLLTEEWQAWLIDLMRQHPDARGYFANAWTVPLLEEELFHCTGQRIAADTIRRSLSQLGYVWKRSRYVLAPDPEHEKKTPYLPENQPIAVQECVAG